MKKYLLSVAVVVIFIFYSMTLRHPDDSTKVIAPTGTSTPASSSSNQSPTSTPTPSSSSGSTNNTSYKDGTYTGSVADAFYGNIQVQATIQGGKITSVKFLDYPHDQGNSIAINQQAMPYLQQEAIKAQSSHVNIITGATDTSQAFIQSLSSALSQAA